MRKMEPTISAWKNLNVLAESVIEELKMKRTHKRMQKGDVEAASNRGSHHSIHAQSPSSSLCPERYMRRTSLTTFWNK